MPGAPAVALTLALAIALSGCGATLRRYPLSEPLWVDLDREPFAPAPEEWYSPYIWDGADNAVFRPLAEVWRLELPREAINVNALDEVPDSSWFTNRLSRAPIAPEELARGACPDVDPDTPGVDADVRGPFTITRGKPDGSSPGFFVRDARGTVHLMKPDGGEQAGRWAASDAIGAAVFHAAGYFVPCNRVVLARREDFVLEPGAEARYTNGRREPLTQAVVDDILDHAAVDADGFLRFGLSQFVDGRPISPWRYEGTWDDDPNDVIPHEHRRDVRAMRVLSAWLGHIDSRQENTLASWIAAEGTDGAGHVRHYMLDFSDCLGIVRAPDRLARRFGHSGYLDVQHIVEDVISLGAIRRPWDDARYGPAGPTFGYYDVEHFDPGAWRPGYPNPAYDRMSERDAAWMARILARFSDAHVQALVDRGRFARADHARELFRVLTGRRDRALARWLTPLSPLALPQIEGDLACAEDLAVSSGLRRPEERTYAARSIGEERRTLEVERREGRVCVRLPRVAGATAERPGYVVVDVLAGEGPLRLHAYDLGGTFRLVGVERPEAH